MGLDIYFVCDGNRVDGDEFYVRIAGGGGKFRAYLERSVFNVPFDIYERKGQRFKPNWGEAYSRLLMYLTSSSYKDEWVPTCLRLMRICWDALYWGVERHQLEWWG